MSAQPLEARLAHLVGAFLQVDRRLETIERAMEARFSQLETRLESRFSIVDQRFNWLIGIVVASWISTVVTVLFRH
ncbi:MAG TPA: hypothetical protein VFF63_08575 [Candidatus Babeliales bacterium]|nr:hypothetical protein [Candidatus Babeliales bacterium]